VCSSDLIVGTGAIVALLALLLVTGGARLEPTGTPGTSGALLAAAGRALWLLAPAALWEELVFRGYLWHVAEEAAGARTALVASSVGFGLVHLLNPGVTLRSVVLVIVAGVCLGLIRQATDSVPAAWLAHLMWNWVMAAVAHAPVSGMPFEAPGWQLVPAGPAWWGGGSWGPEGGAASLLVLLAGVGWWWRVHGRVRGSHRAVAMPS
jgi:membrane protease YdiL (CAAX protease family)